MTAEDPRQILEKVQANLDCLFSCPLHDFWPIEEAKRRYRCRRCGGEVGYLEYIWYHRGREHGRALDQNSQ